MTLLPKCIFHRWPAPQTDSKTSHICMICGIFNRKVNTSLAWCSTHIYWLKGKTGLTSYCFCIQVDHFFPLWQEQMTSACLEFKLRPLILITKKNDWELVPHSYVILISWRYFICEIGKGVRKVPPHWFEICFFKHTLSMSLAYFPHSLHSLRRSVWPPNWFWKKQVSFQINEVGQKYLSSLV